MGGKAGLWGAGGSSGIITGKVMQNLRRPEERAGRSNTEGGENPEIRRRRRGSRPKSKARRLSGGRRKALKEKKKDRGQHRIKRLNNKNNGGKYERENQVSATPEEGEKLDASQPSGRVRNFGKPRRYSPISERQQRTGCQGYLQ